MLKNIVAFAVMLPAFLSYAAENGDKASAKTALQLAQEQGLPVPDGGIILKPESQLTRNEKFKESMERDKASIKKYGYIKKSSPEVQSLLNFTRGNKKFSSKNLTASADSGLYRSINEIQMAYSYYGVPTSAMTKELGVAPAGTYLQGKGWTGAAQIFEKAGIGTCNYDELSVKLNHSSAILAQETVTYDINGKVTQKYTTGEENEGFIYSVEWFDENMFHQLKCVQPNFSTNTMAAVINLAIEIDNNSH